MSDGNNDNEDTDHENGCTDTARGLRGTIGTTIQTRIIAELEIQKREFTCAINNLTQMKKLADSAFNKRVCR